MKKRNVNCRAVPVIAGIVARNSDPLLQEGYVLPAQFFPQPNQTQPEKRLMRAVLEDAINCSLRYRDSPSRALRRLAEEAEEWFVSEEVRLLFAFVPICEALGLNPHYTRAKIFAAPKGISLNTSSDNGAHSEKWRGTYAQWLGKRMGKAKALRKTLSLPVGRIVAILQSKKDGWKETYNLVFAFLFFYFAHPEQRIADIARYLRLHHVYMRNLRDIIGEKIYTKEPLFFEVLFDIAKECVMDTDALGMLLSRLRNGENAV